MITKVQPLEEIRREGLEALRRQLGAVGMIRFLQMFETGKGDYTAERQEWLDRMNPGELLAAIQTQRREKAKANTVHDNATISTWPRMAQVVNEAAEQLQKQYGEEGIPSDVLKREIERIGSYGKDSVIPSDYCYNVVNKASFSFRYWILVRVKRSRYRYVGPGYHYVGPVMWKPKQEQERQVGNWNAGVLTLEVDPRQ